MKVFRQPMSDQATPRRCSLCAEPAKYIVFLPAKDGGINKSAKRFACASHGEK